MTPNQFRGVVGSIPEGHPTNQTPVDSAHSLIKLNLSQVEDNTGGEKSKVNRVANNSVIDTANCNKSTVFKNQSGRFAKTTTSQGIKADQAAKKTRGEVFAVASGLAFRCGNEKDDDDRLRLKKNDQLVVNNGMLQIEDESQTSPGNSPIRNPRSSLNLANASQ